jgi:osomolarity two-component system, sensor histidine kinase SLN1
VTVAEDGQEALDKVEKSMDPNSLHFDIAFMDIQMPNMDGIESTRRIRALGFSAPIIALTAFADESNREACMNVGMNAFLGKPIKRPLLKQVLEEFGKPMLGEESTAGTTRLAGRPAIAMNGTKAVDSASQC